MQACPLASSCGGLGRETGSQWVGDVVAVVLVAVLAVTSLLAWIAYLRFCRFLVKYTKGSSCLKDAAVAARAFRAAGPAAVAQAAARVFGRMRR